MGGADSRNRGEIISGWQQWLMRNEYELGVAAAVVMDGKEVTGSRLLDFLRALGQMIDSHARLDGVATGLSGTGIPIASSIFRDKALGRIDRMLQERGMSPLSDSERSQINHNADEAFNRGRDDKQNDRAPNPSDWNVSEPWLDPMVELDREISDLIEDALDEINKVRDMLDRERSWNEDARSRMNDLYDRARGQIVEFRDPLVLDLDGDGLETVGTSAGVMFDHDASGVRRGTGWVRPSDALVVLDRDGNGTIDNGRELFGTQTLMSDGRFAAHGLEALADLDSNGDGVFDAADERYGEVMLWRDLNQNGISEAGVSGNPVIPTCGNRIFPTHRLEGVRDGKGISGRATALGSRNG